MRSPALLLCCAALAGCGVDPGSLPARRSAIPVVVYERVEPGPFARQMALLRRAGYETVTLATFVRFIRGERVDLPRRPILLTFDGGRRDAWAHSDPILRAHGFHAVVFVDAGRVDAGDPEYLRWAELDGHQRSRRWETQLQSGTGNRLIRYGSAPGDVGPFYAYRGNDEVLGGWRERVFGDIARSERLLALRVPGYTPLAFSPPYGNYGQAGTNDPAIPRLLLVRLHASFAVVFARDRPPLARRGAGTEAPLGRLEAGGYGGEQALRTMIEGLGGPSAARRCDDPTSC
jgi:peptidoglycan/xylan/chitin deacetylase (PgdA/CDA1 family)